MGWQDRHYYRDRGTGSNPLMWLLTGSVPLFTVFGIRVRMHAAMLLLIALELLFSSAKGGMGVQNAMTFSVILFGIVLLHEFGHCFAARSVGGEANEILMWPLGGLAMADAPQRPWPQFVTVAGGPLVNVIICVVTAAAIAVLNRNAPDIPINPLSSGFHPPYGSTFGYYLWWVFIISWSLLLFNLLPIFPLDGGQLLRTILWPKLGFYRASLITFTVGMVGAVLMMMYGVTRFFSWQGQILVFIGLSCLMTCYQLRAQFKAAGPWEFQDDQGDYSASMWQPDEPRKRKKLSRRAMRRLRRVAQEEETEQARIDGILAKVSAHGMQSLTWTERRALKKATERQRRRDLELSGRQD